MKEDGRRPKRVAESLRFHLTQILSRELSDPLLVALVITTVDVPPDLSHARIGVRLLAGDEEQKKRDAVLHALDRVTSRLRKTVGSRLRLRRTPELRFSYDTGHDAAQRVEELLAEIAAESAPEESDP
jgi:ribosome-binding factor A